MQFLANENLPYPSIKILREEGYKVISIYEEFRSIDDESALRKAVEEELIIITFDSDYRKLLFHYKLTPPPAIIYFRRKGYQPDDAAKMLLDGIEIQKIEIEGYFTVIEKDGIRQRRL